MLKRSLLIISALMILVFSFVTCSQVGAEDYDILIVKGKIVDGTGNPWFYGDVGIKGETIVDVGRLTGKKALKTIDAEGLVVCPDLSTCIRIAIVGWGGLIPMSISTI